MARIGDDWIEVGHTHRYWQYAATASQELDESNPSTKTHNGVEEEGGDERLINHSRGDVWVKLAGGEADAQSGNQ